MAQLPSNYDLGNITQFDQFQRYSSIMTNDIATQINGGLQFDANMSSQTVSQQFNAANTEVAITHSLGRVATGFLVSNLTVASIVYAGSTAWDASTIYLKANTPCTAGIIIL